MSTNGEIIVWDLLIHKMLAYTETRRRGKKKRKAEFRSRNSKGTQPGL